MNVQRLPAGTVALAVAAFVSAAATIVIFGDVLGRTATNTYGATSDFLSFYAAGYLVRTGQGAHLYEPSVINATQHLLYPAGFRQAIGYPLPVFVAWLFAPLSLLPFTTAFFLYLSMTATLLAGLLYLLAQQLAGVPRAVRWLFLGSAALALPSLAAIVFGQVDLIVVVGLLGGYLLLRGDRRALAGLPLSLVLVKPHLLVGVALFLILKREWRTISVLAGVGVPLLVVPALLTGPATLVDNAKELASYRSGNELMVNAAVMPNWRGFIVSVTNSNRLIYWAPGFVAIAIGAIAVAASRWRSPNGLAAFDRDYSIAVLLPLLVSPHLHTQNLVVVLLPAALALRAYFGSVATPEASHRATNAILVAFTLLFALPLLAIQGVSLTVFLVLGSYLTLSLHWPGSDTTREQGAEFESAPSRARAA